MSWSRGDRIRERTVESTTPGNTRDTYQQPERERGGKRRRERGTEVLINAGIERAELAAWMSSLGAMIGSRRGNCFLAEARRFDITKVRPVMRIAGLFLYLALIRETLWGTEGS